VDGFVFVDRPDLDRTDLDRTDLDRTDESGQKRPLVSHRAVDHA
jgi:hypothetical protein